MLMTVVRNTGDFQDEKRDIFCVFHACDIIITVLRNKMQIDHLRDVAAKIGSRGW